MESESPSIDPRYRPEFQRGYSGGAAPVPLAAMPRAEEPAIGMPPAPAVAVDSEVVADAPSGGEDRRPRRNPYVFVIPVVALGFVILGTWMLVRQVIWSYSGGFGPSNSLESRFAGTLSYVFSGPLVTVGLAALVGYGFWLAVRGRRS